MKISLLLTLVVTTMASENIDPQLKEFSTGLKKFTAGVYEKLSKTSRRDILVSPLSVDILLALFHNGAKGKTAQEIAEGLHLPAPEPNIDTISTAFSILTGLLRSTDDFISANKVYLNKGFKISGVMNYTARAIFGAEVQTLDFGKRQESADKINNWVEEKTKNKIRELVKSDDLKSAVAVLINALYFRGKWVKQFNANHTKVRRFHINTEAMSNVEQMEIKDKFNVHESKKLNAKFLELPYAGDDTTMTIVLPNDIDGLSKLETHIADVLDAPAYHNTTAHVIIPKIRTGSFIDFKSILKATGIKVAFSNTADFSGFTSKPSTSKGKLRISKIIQRTFIEIDEEGTTAAAATKGGADAPLPAPAAPVFEFIANHPFIYYIKKQGIVAFVGRYTGHISQL